MMMSFLCRARSAVLGLGVAASLITSPPAQAQQIEACVGQLMLFGGNYCPQGFTEADGRMLAVAQYTALFSLYGTMYGGDGVRSFGIPDLRGRAPVSLGQGPGLPNYTQGMMAGAATTKIEQPNLPAIRPTVNAFSGPGAAAGSPGDRFLGQAAAATYATGGTAVTMNQAMISPLGSGQPMGTQSPIQAIRWCVAVQGIYCSRP